MATRRITFRTTRPLVVRAFASLLAVTMGCSTVGSDQTGDAGTSATGGAADAGQDAGTTSRHEKVCNGVTVAPDDPMYGCDPTNCSSCFPFPHASAACAAGSCVLGACDVGYANCDGDPTNGCETDTLSDLTNCGACGAACVLAHASAACTGGVCRVAACDPGGWIQCSDGAGGPDVGCTANQWNDAKNCGGCGKSCAGLETCRDGVCGMYCAARTGDCNDDPTDGCETTLGTDTNCAFCHDDCHVPNAESACASPEHVCQLNGCDPGWDNCDAVFANGCETDLRTVSNCRSCGHACPFGPHSTPSCTASGCAIVCDPGYADCDQDPASGCETDIRTVSNCHACQKTCTSGDHSTPTCAAGGCGLVCDKGYADCDLDLSNGCELATDTASCAN